MDARTSVSKTSATGPIAFAGSPIDRADNTRADPQALAALMNWKARLLALDGLMPALDDAGRLAWGTLADAPEDAELVFLGLLDGNACFAAVPDQGDASPRMANPRLWSLMATLDPGDLALYGGARSLTDWHARHRFCAQCSAPTKIAKGGWQRNCDADSGGCGAQHFPRTDPVTIMLVEHEGRLMLGRGKGWPEGAFSALAGFVEPGETIEEAVAREVFEESGVRARDVSYIASQPWPFPSQLMLGCHSYTDSDELTIDETEMAEVRFFTREEVAASIAGEGPFRAPPKHAIASNLMHWWLEKTA